MSHQPSMNDRHPPPSAHPAANLADPGLPPGTRLGPFEVQRLIARSASSAVYLATDHALALAVAVQEYLPSRLVHRDAALHLHATDEWHEDVIARGLRAFIDEARLLAHCDHPALVRVNQLFEAHGTAYRVMPYYTGRRLVDIRRDMPEAPDEDSLRSLLDDLLGALEAIHQGGRSHGGVTPGNIMLLGDDRPLLLGPGAAGREIGSDLVESLMATIEAPLGPQPGARAAHSPAHGAVADLRALAEVTRFCITGAVPPTSAKADPVRAPALVELIAQTFEPAQRPRYSAGLLRSLDAALSPFPADWPTSAAQFRQWLDDNAPPPSRQRAEPVFDPFGSPADQVSRAAPAASASAAFAAFAGGDAADGDLARARGHVAGGHVRADPRAGGPMGASHSDGAPVVGGISPNAARMATPIPPSARPSPTTTTTARAAASETSMTAAASGDDPAFAETEFATVDRAPWVAPALSRQAGRARRYKIALGAGLAVLAVGVLGLVSGGWNMAPEIAVDRPLATAPVPGPARVDAAAPARLDPPPSGTSIPPAAAPVAAAPPAPDASASTGAPGATVTAEAASAPVTVAAATASAAGPASESVAANATGAAGSTALPATSQAPTQSSAPVVAALDPERIVERDPPAAAPREPAAAAPRERPAAAPRAPARTAVRSETTTPRAVCSGRSEFALYRCMQQVCRSTRWQLHPQCVRLRANDRVD